MNSDIRLSVGFWQHPKTKKTARRIGLEGVRSLQVLWLWAAVNRADGNLTGMDWEDIELAADWQGAERCFFDLCLGMWIDQTEEGYILHDWQEHNSWAAEADDRSGKARLTKLAQVNRVAYEDCMRSGITGLTADEYRVMKRPNSERTANAERTQSGPTATAERTLANGSAPSPSPAPTHKENQDTPPSPPQAGGGGAGDDSPPISDPADVDMGFHEFMAAYPADHRAPEAEAAAVWKKLAREKKLPGLPRLFQGLDEWEASAQWKKQGGEFIPKAANFLRNLMWQDTPPVGLRSASKARAPTPYQQNMADKDALAQALLAERYGEKNNENTDFTQAIDIEHRVRKPSRASAVGPVG